MEASTLGLKDIFERDRRHLVPLFQRPYVWQQQAQWLPLWEDVRSVAEGLLEKREVKPHFLGAIVLEQLRQPSSRVEARLIVDGQQRLTTLQLLLEAASDICHGRGWDKYHRAFVKLTRNEDPLSEDPTDVYKVWPTNTDRTHFRLVMEAQSPAALRKQSDALAGSSSIAQAYLFFSACVEEWLGEPRDTTDRIGALHAALREWIRLVVVDLAADDDPQLIFETLNARGTPLLPADLVKNHLFHMAQKRGHTPERLYEQYWKHIDDEAGYWRAEVVAGRIKRSRIDLFLQHYLSMRTGDDVQVAHLYTACRKYLGESQESPEQQLASLSRYSQVFRKLDQFPAGSRFQTFFARLEDLETTTAHPLLLHAFSIELSAAALESLTTDLESFLMRRLVCRLTTKNYNRLFLDILKSVRVESDAPGAVQRLLLEGAGESVRWPSDEEFRSAWLSMPVYRTLARRRVRTILEALELASRGPKTEALGVPGKLTIEHVLPQSWQDHWPLPPADDPAVARSERDRLVHTMGNLTLLTGALNPSVSNGSWEAKRREIQKHSVLVLNGQIVASSSWDEAAIRSRSESLLQRALELWPRPKGYSHPFGAYATVSKQAMAEPPVETEVTPRAGVACPIPPCPHIYRTSLSGWDAHVGSLRQHPEWHPEEADPEVRRRLFVQEFPGFLPEQLSAGPADRQFWLERSSADAMTAFDACHHLVDEVCGNPRWSYVRRYIALGVPERHFAWFRPLRTGPTCTVHIRVIRSSADSQVRAELVSRLAAAGLSVAPNAQRIIRLSLTASDVARHRESLGSVFANAYEANSVDVGEGD